MTVILQILHCQIFEARSHNVSRNKQQLAARTIGCPKTHFFYELAIFWSAPKTTKQTVTLTTVAGRRCKKNPWMEHTGCIQRTFWESPLCLYYHDNHTGYTTQTTTSWLQTNQNFTNDYDSFQASVTDVKCWKWFTETSQIIIVTGQTHSRPYHHYIYYTVLQQY